jgi:type I restriction enzyme S subunit
VKGWKTCQLGELVLAGGGSIQTGPFGSSLHAADYVSDGLPCIMPMNMKDNRIDVSGIARITDEDAKRLHRHIVQVGDIVYSRRGDVTQKALITERENGYFCGTGCLLLRPGTQIDSEFLTYYLSTSTYQSWIASQAVGATMPNLNTGILHRVSFHAPSKTEQQRIAAVLSALDAKIALNQRINLELEGMAKLLYDYWFVQYDFPLSAAQAAALGKPRLAGQPYRTSGGPMVYHEQLKREIPKGWVAKELSDIAEITMGQSPPGNTYNNEQNGVLFFQGSTDFGWRYPSPRQYTTAPTRMARKGDILLSVRAPVGTLNIAPEECAIGRGLSALRSKSGSSSFLFQILQNLQQVFARRNGDGTTFGSINRDDLRSLQLAYPSEEDIIRSFDRIVSETDALIFANHQQNQELTALRDWLLPMLMNGQVRME